MNACTNRTARWTLLPLLVAVLVGCVGGEEGGAGAPQEPPVFRGMGGMTGGAVAIDLREIGYSRGPDDAPVEVYEFADFGCPYCGMFARDTYAGLHDEFVATGKVRWTYVPVTFGFRGGEAGARAAECAAEQGKFWEMHDLLYARQDEWKASSTPERLSADYARELRLDAGRFASCYREDRGAERTAVNNRAASGLRVRATPSFFINGRLVEGALPAEHFRQVLSAAVEGS